MPKGRPAMTNCNKRAAKLFTYELIESIELHVEMLNEHTKLRPAVLVRNKLLRKGARITDHCLATLMLQTPTNEKRGSDLGARWKNYKVGGLFTHNADERAHWGLVAPGSDPFNLDFEPRAGSSPPPVPI